MKKIIDGVEYNTRTAEALAEVENGEKPSSKVYEKQTLYRTEEGKYFILGVGGENSRFSKRLADDGVKQVRVGVERIKEVAKPDKWAVGNMNTKQYLEFWDKNKRTLERDGHHQSQR